MSSAKASRTKTEKARKKAPEIDVATAYEQVLSIMDNINEAVYISDPENYEVLFFNKPLPRGLWRRSRPQVL